MVYSSMRIEWDHPKERINIRKHGVPFSLAAEIFDDPLHLSVLDKRFTFFEERWITIGATKDLFLLVVAHLAFSEEGEEVIHIISAREATRYEQRQYGK
ncbi:MAG: BrnT family toxin [Spirochaetaceae bacterium]